MEFKSQTCPKCGGVMKPIFSIADIDYQPGSEPAVQFYVSSYECDDCGYRTPHKDVKVCKEAQ